MSSYLPPEQAVATMKREPFFKCVYSSERSEYSFHFRAWSAEEAEAHLRTELKTFAVNAAGEIRVLDSQGRNPSQEPVQAGRRRRQSP